MRKNTAKKEEEEGKGDVETFWDWEMKVDQVMKCFTYNDYEKVRMMAYEFRGYALELWDQ
ncbi:hypothetical protein CR513_07482, partial [Mucuna pruriens]